MHLNMCVYIYIYMLVIYHSLFISITRILIIYICIYMFVINLSLFISFSVSVTTILFMFTYIYTLPSGWRGHTLAKELTAATRIMQSSSCELSTLVSSKTQCKQAKATTWCLIIPKLSDTKSNVKLGRFQSQLEASCVSSHSDELWYNERVCLWMTIYIYI